MELASESAGQDIKRIMKFADATYQLLLGVRMGQTRVWIADAPDDRASAFRKRGQIIRRAGAAVCSNSASAGRHRDSCVQSFRDRRAPFLFTFATRDGAAAPPVKHAEPSGGLRAWFGLTSRAKNADIGSDLPVQRILNIEEESSCIRMVCGIILSGAGFSFFHFHLVLLWGPDNECSFGT